VTSSSDVVALVLHFRTPQATLACLDALRAEGVLRAVIVDNSEDAGRSVAAMATGIARLETTGFVMEWLSPERNLGFAAGVNLGLRHIRSRWHSAVLLINSDARLAAGAMQRLASCLCDAPLAVPTVVEDGPQHMTRPLLGYYQRAFALYLRHAHAGTVEYPSGCCLLLGADIDHEGLFDEDFFFYGEDVMLGASLAQHGLRAIWVQDAFVQHATSTSARNGSLFYEYHMVRGHWLLARKLARNRWEHLLFLLARGCTLPARALVRSVRSCSLRPWVGLWMATMDILRNHNRDLTPKAAPPIAS
jgi:GT2 family glycosyltransferase